MTSRFVPNLRPEQDTKVSGAIASPTKKAEHNFIGQFLNLLNVL